MGFQGTTHGRSGSACRGRCDRPGHCAGRRIAGLERSGRFARRRTGVRRPRCGESGGKRQQRNLARVVGSQRVAPGGDRRRTHRVRRDTEQIAPRRQRHDRDFDGGAASRRRRAPHAVVRLPRAGQKHPHAAAGDPDFRRWRARGPARRHPGLHGHGSGRAIVQRGRRDDRRNLSRRRRIDERGRQAAGCCR